GREAGKVYGQGFWLCFRLYFSSGIFSVRAPRQDGKCMDTAPGQRIVHRNEVTERDTDMDTDTGADICWLLSGMYKALDGWEPGRSYTCAGISNLCVVLYYIIYQSTILLFLYTAERKRAD